jgi:hypothetical protein
MTVEQTLTSATFVLSAGLAGAGAVGMFSVFRRFRYWVRLGCGLVTLSAALNGLCIYLAAKTGVDLGEILKYKNTEVTELALVTSCAVLMGALLAGAYNGRVLEARPDEPVEVTVR